MRMRLSDIDKKIITAKVRHSIKIPQASRSQCMKISRMLKSGDQSKIQEAQKEYLKIQELGKRCGCVQNFLISLGFKKDY